MYKDIIKLRNALIKNKNKINIFHIHILIIRI